MVCLGEPHLPDCEHVRRIETEEIRGAGADFGPGILFLGVALIIVLLAVLS